jgi:hypothetical protein
LRDPSSGRIRLTRSEAKFIERLTEVFLQTLQDCDAVSQLMGLGRRCVS